MREDSLGVCLLSTIRERESGTIRVTENEELVGEVVLRDGQIAWAAAKGQRETLGTLLARLCQLTREQILSLREAYQDSEGRKQLATLVEELGLMPRPMLRKCLLLHTRAAIAHLLARPESHASLVPAAPHTEEGNLFGPEEILPQAYASARLESLRREQLAVAAR